MNPSELRQDKQYWKRVLFTSVPLIVLFAVFARWVLVSAPSDPLAILAASASAFLFAWMGIRFIPQWMAAWSRAPVLPARPMEGKRSGRSANLHPFF